jgi:hypothetical protein
MIELRRRFCGRDFLLGMLGYANFPLITLPFAVVFSTAWTAFVWKTDFSLGMMFLISGGIPDPMSLVKLQ